LHPALSERLTLEQLEEAFRHETLIAPGVHLEERGYPIFYVRFATVRGSDRLLRFDASNYDLEPLDIDLVDPRTRGPLDPNAWITRDGQRCPAHPLQSGRPFLCITGTRAYYIHPTHSPRVTRERWERHRRDMKIVDLLLFIRERFATGRWI
jgi:hypothetical protein